MGQHSIGYKIQELDSKGKRVPEERKGSGQDYIYALFPPDPGSKAEKNRQKKKILLKRPDGTPNQPGSFSFIPNHPAVVKSLPHQSQNRSGKL